MSQTNRVAVFDHYGETDVVRIESHTMPEPGKGEVRVQVKAASINPIDSKVREGIMSFVPGQKFPHSMGSDFAGVVSDVGENVNAWSVGDEVFGWKNSFEGGAVADYVVVPETSLVSKPSNLTFAQASAIPTGGVAALQGIRDVGKIESGMRVLVNGCTGGVGMFAVPLAKDMGSHVTGFAGTKSIEFAQTLGADEVFDYHTTDVMDATELYDIVFELSGQMTFEEAAPILKPNGVFIDPNPSPNSALGSVVYNLFHGQHHGILMTKINQADAKFVANLCESGYPKVTIGAEFTLDQVKEAQDAGDGGDVVGKIVILP